MLQKSNRRCVTHRSFFTSNRKHPFVWGVTGECVIVYGDWAVFALKRGCVCAEEGTIQFFMCSREADCPGLAWNVCLLSRQLIGLLFPNKGSRIESVRPLGFNHCYCWRQFKGRNLLRKAWCHPLWSQIRTNVPTPNNVQYASPFTCAPSVFSSLCLLSFQTLSSSELLNMFLQAGPLQRVTGKTSVWETPWSLSSRDNTTTISRVLLLYTTREFTGVDVNTNDGWIRELFECV